ncbi:MAG: hypothetical protein ACK4ZD_06165 [Caldimonas sp.]|uniref:hypothetical protein n=1 Tax=Caldimonas sp. TaxID=2838790 RepID=UPI00391B7F28
MALPSRQPSPTGLAFRTAAVLMGIGVFFMPALGTWAGLALIGLGAAVGLITFVAALWRMLTA